MRLASLALVSLLLGCMHPTCVQSQPGAPDRALFQRVADSTVQIKTDTAMGSGTVVKVTGTGSYVLTCWHVVEDAISVRVVDVFDGQEYDAIVDKKDDYHDLALLYVDNATRWPALPLSAEEPKLFDRVVIVSSPLGYVHTAADGVVSNTAYEYKGKRLYQITSFTTFGSSGGTVANLAGELIAVPEIVVVKNGNVYVELGFSINLEDIRNFLPA